MGINRVTQNLMTQRSVDSLQMGLARLAKIQEQLSTGRILNRPSDSPTDTTAAMRFRSSIADQQQFARNAQDGLGWLGQTDSTLTGVTTQIRRARDLAVQGTNGALDANGREALAIEIDQIREGLISSANTTYLGRPIFGGVTAGAAAYDASGTFIGTPGAVNRAVGDGVVVDVQVGGQAVFGPDGASLFDDLTALSAALRSGNVAGIGAGSDALTAGLNRVTSTLAGVGTRYSQLEAAAQKATDAELSLSNSLSEVENTDLPKAIVDLKMQEVAYQAALASTARVLQPSLVDFLR